MGATASTDAVITHHQLLEHYAPYIIQEVICTEFGDYITRFDYDGDFVGDNNWDNLGADCGSDCGSEASGCHQNLPLPAYVYSSVMETSTDYYLCYALFHPADDFHCHTFHHENDMEGIVMMVRKTGGFGMLQVVQLEAHNDFYQFYPNGADISGVHSDHDDLDGDMLVIGGSHPVVFVEGGGHGIRREPSGLNGSMDGPFVHYTYEANAQNPTADNHVDATDPSDVPLSLRVGYDLLPISMELWQQRYDICAWGCTYSASGSYEGYRYIADGRQEFYLKPVGLEFSGNDCMCTDGICGAASTPWAWSDNDDWCCYEQIPGQGCNHVPGVCPSKGDWFMDPAWYHTWQFDWDYPPSVEYTFHPYIYNDLGGATYGALTFQGNPAYPYRIKYDVIVPDDKSLHINPVITLQFWNGSQITADGVMTAVATATTPIRFESQAHPTRGITVRGDLRLQNGGSIRF